MSGGYFDYQQHLIDDIADSIDRLIESNSSCADYSDGTIEKFKETSHWLRRSAEMAQRVDWLVSGDDGENSFLQRWETEVRKP